MATSTIQAEKTLLWTNPNPQNTFGAQTVSLDLSSYSAVQILCKERNDLSPLLPAITAQKDEATILPLCEHYNFKRQFDVKSDRVEIGNTISYAAYGNTNTGTYNAYIIPYKIYGIK